MAAGVAAHEPGVTAARPPADSSSLWPGKNGPRPRCSPCGVVGDQHPPRPLAPSTARLPTAYPFQYPALHISRIRRLARPLALPFISSIRRLVGRPELPLQISVVYCRPHHTWHVNHTSPGRQGSGRLESNCYRHGSRWQGNRSSRSVGSLYGQVSGPLSQLWRHRALTRRIAYKEIRDRSALAVRLMRPRLHPGAA
jgi:hypothetical protein